MRQYKFLIVSSILFVSFAVFCNCCQFNNCKIKDTQKDTKQKINGKLQYSCDTLLVDTFPSFNYMGLHRIIKPTKQIINGRLQFVRDSLLSIYLEDNIHCPNYCEGIFHYIILLDIDETGKLSEVTFETDKYSFLQNLIKEAMEKDNLKIPNASFIILYKVTGQLIPAGYDYTHEYKP